MANNNQYARSAGSKSLYAASVAVILLGFVIGYYMPLIRQDSVAHEQETQFLQDSGAWQSLDSQEYEDAIEQFIDYTQANPNNHLSHLGLGWSYYHSGKHSAAIDHFWQSIRIRPMGSAYHGLAQINLENGNLEDSKRYFELALAGGVNKDSVAALCGYGVAYFHAQEYPDAARMFRNCAASNPDSAFAQMGLAAIYHQIGDAGNANKAAEKASALQYTDDSLEKYALFKTVKECVSKKSYSSSVIHNCIKLP